MTFRTIILGGVAGLALISCGKKDDKAVLQAGDSKAAVASSSSPIDKPFSLKSAEELDVDKVLAIFPEAARPTYEAVSFDQKTGATVVTNLRFIDRDPDDDIDMDGLTIERTEFYGVDLDAVERVKSGERSVDAPMEQILAKVRMFGITGDAADDEMDGDFSIGAFEIDTLRLRQGATFEEEEENAAHFFNAFDLVGLYFKDINLAASDGEESETGFSFALPDLRLVGMGGGKLSAIIANDLEVTVNQSDAAIAEAGAAMGPQGALLVNGPLRNFIAPGEQVSKVKSMEWRGIDFSGLMDFGLRDEKPPMTARNLINLGTIKAVDAESFINGKRLSIAPLTTVTAMEFTWLAPSKVRSEAKGVKYDFTAYLSDEDEEALNILKQYNLDKVTADSDFVYDWDANKGGASFSSAFTSKGMASGDIAMSLSGLKLAEIAKLVEAGEAKPVQKVGAFNSFSLTFEDDTLMDAIFALSALQTGGSAEDLRQSVPAMMNMAGLQLAMLNPRFTDYIQALGGFIKNGGTLKVEAKPANPVPLETLMGTMSSEPQTLPDALNLTVTTTK